MPGQLILHDVARGDRSFEVEVKARGHFRRKRGNCSFPPYRLNFKKKEVKGTIFDGLDKVKVVSHCRESRKSFERYIYREYLAYKTLNILTETSFSFRLLNIEYADSKGRYKPRQYSAFFIEPVEQLAKRLDGIPVLSQQIEMSNNRLAVLTAQLPGSFKLDTTSMEGPIQPPSGSIAVGIPAQVLRQRPDVRSAERRLASATYQFGLARAELYPKLRLTGTIGLESTSSSNLLSAASGLFGIGPSISWNIFNGGRVRNEIEIKSIEQEEALIAYEKAVMGALEEVQNGIVFLAQEQVRKETLDTVLERTKESLSLAKLRYEAGETDYLGVLDAEREHLSAIDQVASSEGLVAVYIVRLYKALGGGWESQFPAQE